MKSQFEVITGVACSECGLDYWTVKRAFKVCECGQILWTRKFKNASGTRYNYHQGQEAPPDAVVIGDRQDTPYRGKVYQVA